MYVENLYFHNDDNSLEMRTHKPNVTNDSSTITEAKNNTAYCTLQPNSNETIWYHWRKNGENVGEETESGVLFIPSIKRTDAGNYTCRGRNVACYSASDLVRVIVHCKSVILMKYKQIIISSDKYDALYNIDIADIFYRSPIW